MRALHASYSHDHGSPPEFVELARGVLRVFDIDPTSSEKWNRGIRALRILTADEDARITPWVVGAPAPHLLVTDKRVGPEGHRCHAYCNFPNDKQGKLIASLWTTLVEYYFRGWITAAFYVGFSVEQLSRLQRVGARCGPLTFPTCVPRERDNYLDGETLELQDAVRSASFLTLLSRDRRQVEAFTAFASDLGQVVNGDRW